MELILLTLVFVLYIIFWQKIGFFQTLLVGLYCHQKPEFWFELTTSNHFNSQRDKINALKEYKFSSTLLTLCFVHLIFQASKSTSSFKTHFACFFFFFFFFLFCPSFGGEKSIVVGRYKSSKQHLRWPPF